MSALPDTTRRALLVTGLLASVSFALPGLLPSPTKAAGLAVKYQSLKLHGIDIFYREAGRKEAPTILLLHGFPSSSHMFRDLIPQLATKFRVLAPDYPGFGESAAPTRAEFPYTFAAIADLIEAFTQAVGAKDYLIYMQDYGGPVGFRLAVKHPERVRGIIIQNAVANIEGWDPEIVKGFASFWANRTAGTEKPFRDILSAETTKFQYTQGATRTDRLSPDAWIYDQAKLDRPGNAELQLEMLYQYQDNFAQYPVWQKYLKTNQPPLLILWGKNDPFFRQQAVDYFKAQVAKTEVQFLDAGHFALETHADEIVAAIRNRF